MITQTIEVDPKLLTFILEQSKKQTADIVLVPHTIGALDYHIMGIIAGAITCYSVFESFQPYFGVPLWKDPSMSEIAYMYKDVSPFLKLVKMKENMALRIEYHTYIVNGQQISVGTRIIGEEVETYSPDGAKLNLVPTLPLLPPQVHMQHAFYRKMQWEEAGNFIAGVNLDNDTEFQEIWNGKASDGAKAWIPRVETYSDYLKPYIFYIAKTMFAFSKSDIVKLQIKESIPGESANFFMFDFIVQRKSKKQHSHHHYLAMGIRIE